MGDNMNTQLDEIRANLRTAIAFAKRPGNEGQMLANSKGVYRPVAEVLEPALQALESVDALIQGLGIAVNGQARYLSDRVDSVRSEIETFKANLEPRFQHANAAKAAANRK